MGTPVVRLSGSGRTTTETWPGRFSAIPSFFARWVATIAESTPVRLLASKEVATDCEALLSGVSNAKSSISQPTIVGFATMGRRLWSTSQIIAWKQLAGVTTLGVASTRLGTWTTPSHRSLCDIQSIKCTDSPLCLEGGAIEFDGGGRLIATPDCLLTPTRNPGWTMEQIENELCKRTGVQEFCWLTGGGLLGDDTDGHIDQLARFIDREHIVAAVCDDPSDSNHQVLEQNYVQLCGWANNTTPKLTVHRLTRFHRPERSMGSVCRRATVTFCD